MLNINGYTIGLNFVKKWRQNLHMPGLGELNLLICLQKQSIPHSAPSPSDHDEAEFKKFNC